MPDRFGNPTPREVMGTIVAERQQLAKTQAGRMQVFGQALFGGVDPRLEQAQAIEQAYNTGAVQQEGESALDFGIRNTRRQLSNMNDADMATAARLNDELIGLEDERTQRDNLLADRREKAELAAREAADPANSQRMAVDPNTGKIIPNSSVMLGSDNYSSVIDAVNADYPGAVWMDAASALEVDQEAAEREMQQALLESQPPDRMGTATSVGVIEEQALSAKAMASTAEMVVDTVMGAVEAGQGTAVGSLEQAITIGVDKVIGSLQSAAGYLGFLTEDGDDAGGIIPSVRAWAREYGVNPAGWTAQYESLLGVMAYQHALQFNRRVTDADYRASMKMLGGVFSHPTTALTRLRAQLEVADAAHSTKRHLYNREDNRYNWQGNGSQEMLTFNAVDEAYVPAYASAISSIDAGLARLEQLGFGGGPSVEPEEGGNKVDVRSQVRQVGQRTGRGAR